MAKVTKQPDDSPAEQDESLGEAQPVLDALFQQLQSPRLKIDMKLVEELATYDVFRKQGEDGKLKRTVPLYFHSVDDLEQLVAVFDRVQAYRERVVHISMRISAIRRALQEMLDTAQAEVGKLSNVRAAKPMARKQVMRSLLLPLVKRIDDADHVLSMCEQTKKTLEGAYFCAKEMSEIGKFVLDAKASEHRKNVRKNV